MKHRSLMYLVIILHASHKHGHGLYSHDLIRTRTGSNLHNYCPVQDEEGAFHAYHLSGKKNVWNIKVRNNVDLIEIIAARHETLWRLYLAQVSSTQASSLVIVAGLCIGLGSFRAAGQVRLTAICAAGVV